MSGNQQNWREETNAGDYFLHQQKQLDLADRRPVIRSASDLVGPGIGSAAVRITDFNNLLATFNGYYSALPGAADAPNSTEAFIGQTLSDAVIGGRQVFTGLTSGIEYARTFTRSPTDPESIGWSAWTGQRVPATATTLGEVLTMVPGNTVTLLTAPVITPYGEEGVYERTEAGIFLRKQGVYTGHIQVEIFNDLVYIDTKILLYRPNGSSSLQIEHFPVQLNGSYYMPFTVVAEDEFQGFSVTISTLSADPYEIGWRFACTRVGDAI